MLLVLSLLFKSDIAESVSESVSDFAAPYAVTGTLTPATVLLTISDFLTCISCSVFPKCFRIYVLKCRKMSSICQVVENIL